MELMVSVALMGIVLMYVMQSFSAQQRTYVMVDQVTEAQQNLRAISELVERDIRLAGFMVDEAGAVCGLDSTNAPDTLFVSDASALDPSTAIQPTLGARIPGQTPSSGALALSGGDNVVLDGVAAYDTDNNGVNDSDFRPGAGVIIYDRNDATRGSACGTVTAVVPNGTSVTVNLLASNLSGVAAGAQLVAVPAHVYQINGNAQLLRDGMVLAEDVEDMQVAYFFDANNNGIVDAGENPGVIGQPYVAANRDNSTLREVRVNFVVRTRGADPTFTQGQFQTTENRVGVPAPTAQDPQTRRRVHTTTVRIRNVGNRGLLG
jgi:Tfp pilus assembly protein PilW